MPTTFAQFHRVKHGIGPLFIESGEGAIVSTRSEHTTRAITPIRIVACRSLIRRKDVGGLSSTARPVDVQARTRTMSRAVITHEDPISVVTSGRGTTYHVTAPDGE